MTAPYFTDSELRRWSRMIKVLDRGECKFCGSTDPAMLQSHHIMPKGVYPSLALDIYNGITLCMICHQVVVHGRSIRDGGRADGNWDKFVDTCDHLARGRDQLQSFKAEKLIESHRPRGYAE